MANLFWKRDGKSTLNLISTPFKSEGEFEEVVFDSKGIRVHPCHPWLVVVGPIPEPLRETERAARLSYGTGEGREVHHVPNSSTIRRGAESNDEWQRQRFDDALSRSHHPAGLRKLSEFVSRLPKSLGFRQAQNDNQ